MEIAAGTVTGGTPAWIPHRSAEFSPADVLERCIRTALLRPPCLLSFSGGLDSSLLLALATTVARREGLAPPVPVTWRFTGAPRAGETEWQEQIIQALDVRDWHILTAADDLDLVGPVAQELLLAHGVRYPANLHLHLPIVAAAAGGSVITGLGGDQVLSCWRPRSRPPNRLRSLVPASARAARRPWQARTERPWLHAQPARLVHRRERYDRSTTPRTPMQILAWRTGRRHLALTRASCADLAAACDVQLHHPLLDMAFHIALRDTVPPDAVLTRGQLIAAICGDRMPAVAYRRTDKAWFGEVFRRAPTREFTSHWDGGGLDDGLVDRAGLREVWSHWPIPADTSLLVQQLWLAQQPVREGSP